MTKTFTDNKSRIWTVEFNVTVAKRIRALLDIDPLSAEPGKDLATVINDPIMLADVLYVVCKPQADAAGVTDEQFGEGLAGDAINAATAALMEAYIGFFSDPRKRDLMNRSWIKTREGEAKLLEASRPMVEAAIDEAVEKAQQEIAAVLGKASTSSPASSA